MVWMWEISTEVYGVCCSLRVRERKMLPIAMDQQKGRSGPQLEGEQVALVLYRLVQVGALFQSSSTSHSPHVFQLAHPLPPHAALTSMETMLESLSILVTKVINQRSVFPDMALCEYVSPVCSPFHCPATPTATSYTGPPFPLLLTQTVLPSPAPPSPR